MKEYTDVTPSGIEFVVRNLVGSDYDILTKQGSRKDESAFEELCAAVMIRLGNDTNITKGKVEKMLTNDRKYILLQTRQHTMRFDPNFEFSYEWPLKEGKKQLEKYTVDFNRDDFEVRPYYWVQEMMDSINELTDSLADEEKERSEELKSKYKYDPNGIAFPVMFENYQELEDSGLLLPEFITEDGVKIRWRCVRGTEEAKFGAVPVDKRTINTTLLMHKPQETATSKKNPAEKVHIDLNVKNTDAYDLEKLRKDIHDREGEVNTFLVIESSDGSRKDRVDLLQVTAFFFPSQAV